MNKTLKYNIWTILIAEILFWSIGLSVWYYFIKNVEEFRFENKNILWLLVYARAIILIYLLSLQLKKKRLKKYGSKKILKHLVVGVAPLKSALKFGLFLLAISFLIIAWANPQFGKNEKKMNTSGIDIMLALDVSNSMLAKDLDAKRNRLDVAKLGIIQLLKKLKGDRVGVVVFAGTAYNYIPITNDYDYVKLEMLSIDPGMISSQGTAIGSAIETAMASFDENKTNKAIIIFTDGENHEDNALSSAKDALKEGIKVFTVGMGTPRAVPIPSDEYGQDYHKDKNGNTVLTKLNEQMLADIAKKGGGIYERANRTSINTDKILERIGKIEKSTFKAKTFLEYEDRFQWFLAVGILLLLLDSLITTRKRVKI
jgi:Ca-activated chloride channel family protein